MEAEVLPVHREAPSTRTRWADMSTEQSLGEGALRRGATVQFSTVLHSVVGAFLSLVGHRMRVSPGVPC